MTITDVSQKIEIWIEITLGFFSQNNQEWRRNVNVDILKWKKIDEK